LAPDEVIRAISSSSLLSESIRLELLLMFLEAIFLPPNHENLILIFRKQNQTSCFLFLLTDYIKILQLMNWNSILLQQMEMS
jgi:hypothetical protein